MKKIILSAFIVMLAVSVKAQEIPERKSDSPHMMERKGHPHGKEFQNLNLTTEQNVKFKSQNENFRRLVFLSDFTRQSINPY